MWRSIGLVIVFMVFSAVPPLDADDSSPYSLLMHVKVTSYAGCMDWDMDDVRLDCGVINTDGIDESPYAPIGVWIVMGGVPPCEGTDGGIGGVQFGIRYEDTVQVNGWSLCNSGAGIAGEGWPDSGTGYAAAWPGGCYCVTENDDGLTKIGYFYLISGYSHGGIWIAEHPEVGYVEASDWRV